MRCQLAMPGSVVATIYDVCGRIVSAFDSGPRSSGGVEWAWDGTDRGRRPAGSGVYLLDVEAGGVRHRRQLILLR